MRHLNNYGSIVPLFTFLALIFFAGLLIAILGLVLEPVAVLESNMDTLMWRGWIFAAVVIFIVLASWLLMRAQKPTRGQ